MLCGNCRKELVTRVPLEAAEDECEMRRHLEECPDCAKFAAQMETTVKAVRCLPVLEVRDDFRRRVRSRLVKVKQVRRRPSWVEALLGPLRTPFPALQTREVLVGLCLIAMIAVVLAFALHQVGPARPFGTGQVAIHGSGPVDGGGLAPGGQAVSFNQRQMLLSHQNRQLSHPLQRDAGYYLVDHD